VAGLVESARAILGSSERVLETVSNNVSNVSTPGFKRQTSFSDVVSQADSLVEDMRVKSDLRQGALSATSNPLDLAISGDGFFRLRSETEIFYSRQGHFRLSPEGLLVSPQGFVLQGSDGGDLVVESAEVEIAGDGTVIDGGRPVGRIGVFAPVSGAALHPVAGSLFRADAGDMEESRSARIRQAMVEGSNVTLGEEMVTMMTAVRQAESGARIVQVYDDLIGRAITAFGQGGR